ncbi:hypothetical protein [Bacillus sp. ISL-39]|uniref:hypothetical protein n=1 Tax=Bacillus sp. ISL-39 TaxID=2819124 RepID=UPI001BE65CB6|nr:hypothetical protein [Bacillus sp. ISL-39]MBT2636700.1 hypothetical protein [Bacillus sp. ISL-39]
MITKEKKSNLYVRNDNEWSVIPVWANSFINIGNIFHQNLPSNARAKLVLTVPTRLFAGVFIAYGAILSSISEKVDKKLEDKHFQMLKGLNEGTSVIYRKQNRIYRAIYSGLEMVADEERIRITIQAKEAGNLTEILNKRQALAVQVATDKNYKLPKDPKGRQNNLSDFLKTGYKGFNYDSLLTLSQSQFYYIGSKKWVKNEAVDTELAVYDSINEKFVTGNLQELLRIKEFGGEQDSYQSQIISASSNIKKYDFQNITNSTFTIFDGANSYLRWREKFKETHSILILDRTEAQFETALFELDDEYTLIQKVDRDLFTDTSLLPKGIELKYWEAL